MPDWLTATQEAVGSVAEDVVQLDAYFDRLLGTPTVEQPSKQSTSTATVPVAPTPTTLVNTQSQRNTMIVLALLVLGLWLRK